MSCNCSDWQKNDITLDMAFFNSLINDRNLRHCAVKPFVFCPWRGQRLTAGEQLRQRREKETCEDEQLGRCQADIKIVKEEAKTRTTSSGVES